MQKISMEKLQLNMLDPLLELLTVLYLKSDDIVKVNLLRDIKNVFQMIKQNETKIIVE
jgi:hypothetical protein